MPMINGSPATYVFPGVIANELDAVIDSFDGTAFVEKNDRVYAAAAPNSLSFSNDDGSLT